MQELYLEIKTLYLTQSIFSWIIAFVFTLGMVLVFKLSLLMISKKIRTHSEKVEHRIGSVFADLLDGTKVLFIFFWFFLLVSKTSVFIESFHKYLFSAAVMLSIFQIIIWGLHVITNWRSLVLNKKIQKDPSSSAAIGLLYTAVQTFFIFFVILIGLGNLGIDIGALLAGLGVGGIAIALAAQNILGDLLASLSIVFDKPFVVGDYIVTENEGGIVESIGIKTTRIRSLLGEEIILSNKDLLESRIHNFKSLWQRRVVQKVGVTYSTQVDHIEKIPIWIKEFIDANPKLRFDRCHFSGFGDSSLDFEFVFFVIDPDYKVFMDLQQQVLISIFKKFDDEKIDFAFPSRSLYIQKFTKK